ncbi:hypothetical protein HPP92_020464 [Vanilla planifolia]|uniref:Coiled-coil domain-containing protein 12 n=1 Tax=Vanilla planifolia TaxID=51239 RepID=A0A835Q3Q3_VANPL|nr:hypothetical protein HPP92_020464 [Vanilla planifolia]
MALRAPKEYASMPDADGDGNKNNKMEESTTNDYEQKVAETIEEGSTEQASAARKERLMALKTANELLSTTDDITKNNGRLEGTEENGENIRVAETIEDGSTEQASAARKERLMALKTANELLSTTDDITKNNGRLEGTEENGENIAPNMKFRNYLPHDIHLQEGKLASVELPKFEDPVAPTPQPSEKTEDPFVNIAPKKPNWDLRRDVQKRLDKLERRTQKALYELMLEQEKDKGVTELANGGFAD